MGIADPRPPQIRSDDFRVLRSVGTLGAQLEPSGVIPLSVINRADGA